VSASTLKGGNVRSGEKNLRVGFSRARDRAQSRKACSDATAFGFDTVLWSGDLAIELRLAETKAAAEHKLKF
jgi:hypothetical protein